MALDLQCIDTSHLPADNRLATLRDFLARELMGVEITPRKDDNFTVTVNALVLPELRLVRGYSDPLVCERSRAMLADGQDDYMLDVMTAPISMTLEGRWQVEARAGDGLLYPLGSSWRMVHGKADVQCLRFSRAALVSLLPDLDAYPLRVLRPEDGLLGLLMGYAGLAFSAGPGLDPKVAGSMSQHIRDLAAHALGQDSAKPMAPETRRAAAAMRLDLLKAEVERCLADQDFGILRLAKRYKVTPRYIQMLFAESGTTFTDYLRRQRLLTVYRALSDPAQDGTGIAELAYAAGFSDLSHFNKAFRQRFGATPREMRTTFRADRP